MYKITAAAALTLIWAAPASGQCMRWDAGVGLPPIGDIPCCMNTHDDGTGRALYAGFLSSVKKWTGASWLDVGTYLDGLVAALCEYDDGTGVQLFAGGSFQNYAGAPLPAVGKLVGSDWQGFGGGLPSSPGTVLSLAVFDDGGGPKLYVGGVFDSTGALTDSILTWDGS